MKKRILPLISASAIAVTLTSCGGKTSSSKANTVSISTVSLADPTSESTSDDDTDASEMTNIETTTEEITEPVTQHISPVETVSVAMGTQVQVDKTIPYTTDQNIIKLPLADLIEEGDKLSSVTFEIYSADGANIGDFKGGFGISVSADCPAATTKYWYQSPDTTQATQGTYGEIKWDVPAEIQDYITAGGDLLFGYWYGGASSIRIDCAICTFTRSREVTVDGTVTMDAVGSASLDVNSNTVSVNTAGFLPENAVPEVVTFNVSSDGAFKKLVAICGYNSEYGYAASPDSGIITDSSSAEVTWFLNNQAKSLVSENGELLFTYGWSQQPTIRINSMTVKYSLTADTIQHPALPSDKPAENVSGFRPASQIAEEIKVGWNLGNTLEAYNYAGYASNAETAWGNPKTTEDMIMSVKDAGFNAIRIPVTWGEHLNGDQIDAAWMNRVQEVVDYAYNNDMFVILNMHHDDYTWFDPLDSEYESDRAQLINIWNQICDRFGDYDDRLLFEGMNEPRNVNSAAEWTGGTAAERAVVNKYINDFVETVRASGKKNGERTLLVPSYAASAETVAINDVMLPADNNLILSIHYYAPWKFSDGTVITFTESDKNDINAKFDELKTKFIDKGTPVLITEFGCVNAANNTTRASYYEFYIEAAKAHGIHCFIWDNGVSSGNASYGIFSRNTLDWNQDIINAVMSAAN